MTSYRVTYREGIIMANETFTTFEDAWAFSRLFPPLDDPESTHKRWRYIAKHEVQHIIEVHQKVQMEDSLRLVISWIPNTKMEVTMTVWN